MATQRRNDLIHQLLGVVDENLDEFLETRRQPTLPVKQKGIRVVEPGWTGNFTWESVTTDLGGIGFAFGDIVLDKTMNCYRRVIAYRKEDYKLWLTGTKGHSTNTIHNVSPMDPGRFEKCSEPARRQDIATIVDDVATDDSDALEAIRAKLEMSRLPTNQDGGLKLWGGVTSFSFPWREMTDRLADLGLAFGDVVRDKTTGHLHRVVGHNGHLWITSATQEDGITCDPHPENFEKV